MNANPAFLLLLLLLGAVPVHAQVPDTARAGGDTTRVFLLDGVNVTATREPRSVFSTPAPVTVIDLRRVRRSAGANIADIFRDVPGLDAEGVGLAQRRPVVRGMRGQRVLLLEDGLRLNNARRRVDSGEPTGLVWTSSLERVEVVRGPASVLYGSDAVGGVVNLVTRDAPVRGGPVHGFVEAGYRSAGGASTVSGEAAGALGNLGWRISGGLRDAGSYRAPAGRFGELTVSREAEVHDSAVRDGSIRAELRYRFGTDGSVFLRHEAYSSEESGFGWIDPEIFGPEAAKTRLVWPDQDFGRTVVGVRIGGTGWALADALEVTAYRQSNERFFITEVLVPVPTVPGATTEVVSENFTDLDSDGLRVELRKLVGAGVALTYGLDAFQDRSAGTDTSTTTITGLGPTTVRASGGPQVPDARQRSVGAFLQARWDLDRSTEILGGVRYQDVRSRSLVTPGNDIGPESFREGTLVGSASILRRAGDHVTLVGSVSRGFRMPNLVERFFTGFTGGNRGFWEANPELGPESSVNVDVGARLRTDRVQAQLFGFQNTLRDGIVLEPTGETMGRAVVYRNVNVDELRFRGLEASVVVELGRGLGVEADATVLDVEDRRDPTRVLAESYPGKMRFALRHEDPGGRFWAAYGIRRNGRRETLPGATPVGDAIPAFSVHDLRMGGRLFRRHRVTVAVENLANTLYAEALNTGFFRPEPGRNLSLTWTTEF